MTFLELAKAVARESGTISGDRPLSVVNATGREAKVCQWVVTAWRYIQNERNAWLFMRGEFTGDLNQGQSEYVGAAFGITRLGSWVFDLMSVYLTSAGVADERNIHYIKWPHFRDRYRKGVQTQGRPQHFSVAPNGDLCIGPAPDASYTINGEYRKSPQTLVDNTDIPDMPNRYHDTIIYKALQMMAAHDEAVTHISTHTRMLHEQMGVLEREQLPRTIIGSRPLA